MTSMEVGIFYGGTCRPNSREVLCQEQVGTSSFGASFATGIVCVILCEPKKFQLAVLIFASRPVFVFLDPCSFPQFLYAFLSIYLFVCLSVLFVLFVVCFVCFCMFLYVFVCFCLFGLFVLFVLFCLVCFVWFVWFVWFVLFVLFVLFALFV